MSDTQQGPDWWKASDGRWYPPQPAVPAKPAKTSNKGCLVAALVVLGLLAVLVVGGVVAVLVLGNATFNRIDRVEGSIEDPTVDPANPDAREGDQRVEIGGSVELSGYTTTVRSAQFVDRLNELETEGYLVVDVIVFNRDDEPQPFSVSDWRLQTPNGQLLDPAFTSAEGALTAGELIKGGNVRGSVVFEIGAATGEFFLIYEPDPVDGARGLWAVELR